MAFTGPIYVISVAARLLDMHPQTLRKYERWGLVEPIRTGAIRLYSAEDIARLRFIRQLTEAYGLNLAGAQIVLRLIEAVERLSAAVGDGDAETCARAPVETVLREMMDMLRLNQAQRQTLEVSTETWQE